MIRKPSSRRGIATLEMMAGCLFLLVPCLLALAELCRLDRTARELQYAAQAGCITAAVAGDEDPGYRLIPLDSSIQYTVLPGTASRLGIRMSRTLKRTYWVATGSGYGED